MMSPWTKGCLFLVALCGLLWLSPSATTIWGATHGASATSRGAWQQLSSGDCLKAQPGDTAAVHVVAHEPLTGGVWILKRTYSWLVGPWLRNAVEVDSTQAAPSATAADDNAVYALPSPTPTATSAATLAVAKLVDLDEASAGDELHYTLVIMNDMLIGPDPGVDVQLEDVLPDIVELVPGSLSPQASYDAGTHTIRWTGQVPRGGSVQIDFRALLTPAAAGWRSVTNTVLVTDAFGRVVEALAHTQLWPPTTTPTPTEVTPVIEDHYLFIPISIRND